MKRFEGRVAIVTGAGSGIGRATVERLTAEGARIVAVDVDEGQLKELADDPTTSLVAGDVSDPGCAEAAVAMAVDRFGQLDVLANVAGILRTSHTHEASLEEWDRVLAVNLTGTFLFCRAAIPVMVEAGGGAIVNTASTAGMAGHPWAAAYAASKGGVLALTRTLAVEYGRRGIRANSVCPSGITTPMADGFAFPDGADTKLVYRLMPLDGNRGPETVAAAIAFLASDDAAHVNGEELRVDGATLA